MDLVARPQRMHKRKMWTISLATYEPLRYPLCPGRRNHVPRLLQSSMISGEGILTVMPQPRCSKLNLSRVSSIARCSSGRRFRFPTRSTVYYGAQFRRMSLAMSRRPLHIPSETETFKF